MGRNRNDTNAHAHPNNDDVVASRHDVDDLMPVADALTHRSPQEMAAYEASQDEAEAQRAASELRQMEDADTLAPAAIEERGRAQTSAAMAAQRTRTAEDVRAIRVAAGHQWSNQTLAYRGIGPFLRDQANPYDGDPVALLRERCNALAREEGLDVETKAICFALLIEKSAPQQRGACAQCVFAEIENVIARDDARAELIVRILAHLIPEQRRAANTTLWSTVKQGVSALMGRTAGAALRSAGVLGTAATKVTRVVTKPAIAVAEVVAKSAIATLVTQMLCLAINGPVANKDWGGWLSKNWKKLQDMALRDSNSASAIRIFFAGAAACGALGYMCKRGKSAQAPDQTALFRAILQSRNLDPWTYFLERNAPNALATILSEAASAGANAATMSAAALTLGPIASACISIMPAGPSVKWPAQLAFLKDFPLALKDDVQALWAELGKSETWQKYIDPMLEQVANFADWTALAKVPLEMRDRVTQSPYLKQLADGISQASHVAHGVMSGVLPSSVSSIARQIAVEFAAVRGTVSPSQAIFRGNPSAMLSIGITGAVIASMPAFAAKLSQIPKKEAYACVIALGVAAMFSPAIAAASVGAGATAAVAQAVYGAVARTITPHAVPDRLLENGAGFAEAKLYRDRVIDELTRCAQALGVNGDQAVQLMRESAVGEGGLFWCGNQDIQARLRERVDAQAQSRTREQR